MLPNPVSSVNAACLVVIVVVGIAYYIRTRHLPRSRQAEDRRARLYVVLMCGAALFGLSVALALDGAMRQQR